MKNEERNCIISIVVIIVVFVVRKELDKICAPRKCNRRNWPGRGLKRTTSFFYTLDIMRKNSCAVKES